LTAAVVGALLRLGHEASHPAQLANLLLRPSGAGVGHRKDRIEALLVLLQGVEEHLGDLVVRLRPDVDDLVVSLVVGNEAHRVVLLGLLDLLVGLFDELLLLLRHNDVRERERHARGGGAPEAHVLDVVEELGRLLVIGLLQHLGNHPADVLGAEHLVHVVDAVGQRLVEDDAPHGRVDHLAGPVRVAQLDLRVQRQSVLVVGLSHLIDAREAHALSLLVGLRLRDVVEPQHHVLTRHGERPAVGRAAHVVARQHQNHAFEARLVRERHVQGHLVPVEVGVIGRADERVNFDRFVLGQHRLKGLNAEPVERGGTVEQNRPALYDLL
jgi:hypothetical protein